MSLSARARTLSGVRLLIYEHAHEAVAEIGPVAGLGSVHMRGGFLERVVMASLGVSVVMTLGCDITPFPTTPSPTTFSVLAISPPEGPTVLATTATIKGTGFRSGDTVTVDGSRVDATVDSASTISLTMPAHAAGKVDVTVISALSQARASVPGGYSYVPPEPSAAQRNAALALFDAAIVHAAVTTFPLWYGSDYGKAMWTNGPCASGQGSMQASVDGVLAPTPGTFLPTGSHTYVVSFSNCRVNWYFNETELNGVASAAYNAADWNNITATVSADSVRGKDMDFGASRSELSIDVTADGSAVWTRSSNSTTYTPAAGSRLVNNLTTNVATFGGGSYSTIPQGGSSTSTQRFDNLKVAINGTEYTLNGSLVETHGSRSTFAGEIQIITNGMLAARIVGDGYNLRVEVHIPLVPL